MSTVDYETKTRSFAVSGYGLPAMQRPGVNIVTEAHVQRILFKNSGADVIAVGVDANIQGQVRTVKARREVILAAGVFTTPKLLELSGIGNDSILRQLGISTVVNNPNVGENLQDHLMSGVSLEVADGISTGDSLLRLEPEALQAAMHLYAEHRAGPMAAPGVQPDAYMPVGSHQDSFDMKNYLGGFPSTMAGRDKAIYDIFAQPGAPTCSVANFLAQVNLHESGKSFVGQSLLPGNFLSIGFSNAQPRIDPRYFSHPLDLEIMVRNLLDVEKPLATFLEAGGQCNHPDAFLTDLESAKRYLYDTVTFMWHCGHGAPGKWGSGG